MSSFRDRWQSSRGGVRGPVGPAGLGGFRGAAGARRRLRAAADPGTHPGTRPLRDLQRRVPGDWHIEPRVVLGDDAHGALLFRWTLDGESSLAVAFFEHDGALITKVTDFWPEPYDPPPGREHLVERW